MPVTIHCNGDVCVFWAKQRRSTITIITTVTLPPVMVVTMVMVTAYCYGREYTHAQAKRVLPAENLMRGATARHCATVRVRTEVCRVCSSHPAVRGNGPNAA